jgi:tetratricopeptide (TPR) repeat protein
MTKPHDPNVTTDVPSAPAEDPRVADALATSDHAPGSASTDGSQPDADALVSDLPAVPGYRVLREIARGGMGRVLAAFDLGLEREVALKVLLPGAKADRFVRESKITARLPHPGIPPVHALGTLADGSPFLAMKLVAGHTLAAKMRSADRPRLLQAFVQVCQAVGFAHSRGVVHRDLKPANVMVGAFGEVQVMDWGLAKVLGGIAKPQAAELAACNVAAPDATHAGAVLGTPAYMAPEQARGGSVDERADVFALGGILCAILTGQPPFSGKSTLEVIRRAGAADLEEAYARLDSCGADAELVALCRRCLSPSPRDRPADGQTVADGLTIYLDGVQERLRQAELAEAEAKAKAIEEVKRRRLTLALAATVLLAVLGGGGGWLYVKNERELRQTHLTREVNDALNRATGLREKARSANAGSAALFAQAREQAQRALALIESGPADTALVAQVRELQVELNEEEQDRTLVATLDEARLAQAETLSENRFAFERAIPKFREAFTAYGLPADEADPAAAGERIRNRPPAVRETIIATLEQWEALATRFKGKIEPHREWLHAVVEAADPDDNWRKRLRAVARETSKDRQLAALSALAKSVDVRSTSPSRVCTLALGLPPSEAADLLRRAKKQRPADFWINHELGMAFKHQSPPNLPEAVRFLTAAVALRPDSLGALQNLGTTLAVHGRVDDAIEHFQRAIQLNQRYAVAHDALGTALMKKGQLDEAIASHRKALEIDPKNALAHGHMGAALASRGQIAAGIDHIEKAIALDPKTGAWHSNLGIVRTMTGQVDRAIACFRKAVELDRKHAIAHFNLGNALFGKGKVDEAIACFRQAIALDPNDTRFHNNLGFVLSGKGQLEEAIASYRKAIDLDPKSALVHSNLGKALMKKQQVDEAIACFRKTIELTPKDGLAHCDLGRALGQQGRFAESLEAIKRGHALGRKQRGWNYPSALWVRLAEQSAALEARLPAFLEGEFQPTDTAERLGLAGVCQAKKLHHTAARLYADAFAADPRLAGDLARPHRYNAACCAALAAAGKGEDAATLTGQQRLALRRQALTWLRADLQARQKQLTSWWPGQAAQARDALKHWQRDSDLSCIRDKAALEKLPPDEQQGFIQLWAGVAAQLKRAKEAR